MIVASIDPGYGTGYAIYNTDNGAFDSWETYEGVLDFRDFWLADIIICESYQINEETGHKTQQLDALKHIGKVEEFCNKSGKIELVMQMPSMKKFAKAHGWRNLKAVGWYTKTKDDHAADAAAHLLNYLLKKKLLRAEEVRALRNVLHREN